MESLTHAVQSIVTNPWFGLSTFFVGFLIGVWGIVATARATKDKRPRYAIVSQRLIEDLPAKNPAIEVHYRGHADTIHNLTVTRIAFWNAGRETIRKEDFLKEEPPAVSASNGLIVQADVVRTNNTSNRFEIHVNREKTKATMSFDYLDHKDKAVIQLFHTAAAPTDLSVAAKFKGARRLRSVPVMERMSRRARLSFTATGPILCGLLLVVYFGRGTTLVTVLGLTVLALLLLPSIIIWFMPWAVFDELYEGL